MTGDGNSSFGRIIKAFYKINQGRFTRAGLAEDADGLSVLDVESDIREYVFLCTSVVSETDMVEVDTAVSNTKAGILSVDDFTLAIEHFLHTGKGSAGSCE